MIKLAIILTSGPVERTGAKKGKKHATLPEQDSEN